MSGVKHTPGPWVSEHSVDEWGVSIIASNEKGYISNPTRGQVCHISVVAGAAGDNPNLALANARLIAAAPDLLAVAIKSHEPYEGLTEDDIRSLYGPEEAELAMSLRAAIARARGEPDGGVE